MAHHGWIYYDKYTYQYKLIYDAWYTYHSPMGRGPFAHNCGRSSTVPILQLWNEKFWVLNTALLHIYVYIILRMLRMGWWSIHLDLPREFVSPGRVQEKKRNQLNANFKVATGTCWVHLTCPGWSFWRPTSQARRKLGDRGRSRCMRKHSHPGIVVLITIFSMILRMVMVMNLAAPLVTPVPVWVDPRAAATVPASSLWSKLFESYWQCWLYLSPHPVMVSAVLVAIGIDAAKIYHYFLKGNSCLHLGLM